MARAHPGAGSAPFVSRSYRAPFALVAWHETRLGVDLERIERAERDFAASICTPEEISRFADRLDEAAFVTSLWASKEALAKALGDAVAYDPRRLESPLAWENGIAGRWHANEFVPIEGHVAWMVWDSSTRIG